MTFKVKYHKNHRDFAEYTGYNNSGKRKQNYFRQLEIPNSMLTKFDIHNCEAKVGDFRGIIPRVKGTAKLTGYAKWFLDPEDSVGRGFVVS